MSADPRPDDAPHDSGPAHDPRLEIPEVLRTPVKRPDFDPVTGGERGKKTSVDAAGMARAWATAFDFVFTIIAGAVIGWVVDHFAHTQPLWTLVGLGVGFVGAFIRIIRLTLRQSREEDARRRK